MKDQPFKIIVIIVPIFCCQGPDHVFEQAVARRGGSEKMGKSPTKKKGVDHENVGYHSLKTGFHHQN